MVYIETKAAAACMPPKKIFSGGVCLCTFYTALFLSLPFSVEQEEEMCVPFFMCTWHFLFLR